MKALVVVDMQNDFIDGSLGTAEARRIIGNVVEKIETAGDSLILFTKDTHGSDYLETQEGRKLPVTHCIDQTEGWNINKDVARAASGSTTGLSETTFCKNTFGSKELAQYLESRGDISEIEIIGVCTDICVLSNAILLKAFLPEAEITVDASCCAGVTPQSHNTALEAMKMCQINVTNL